MLSQIGGEISHQRELLLQAEDEMQAFAEDLKDQIRLRNQATANLTRPILKLRELATGLYGPEGPALVLGTDEDVPRNPVALLEYARTVYRYLTSIRDDLPEPLLSGACLQPTVAARELEEPQMALAVCLGRIAVIKNKHTKARDARNAARARIAALVKPTRRLLQALEDLMAV